MSMSTPAIVPQLVLASTPERSPRPQLWTPRTHREQLQLTGEQLGDALESAQSLHLQIAQLSSRAQFQRAEFLANVLSNGDANVREQCPICLEKLSDPLACTNSHRFCGGCLRSYRQKTFLQSPRLLCAHLTAPSTPFHALPRPFLIVRPPPHLHAPGPLCRVVMPDVLPRPSSRQPFVFT